MYNKVKGGLVAEIDANKYKEIAGEFRNNLSKHIFVYVERVRNADGRKIARLSSRYPRTAKKVLYNILGEDYIKNSQKESMPTQEIPKRDTKFQDVNEGFKQRFENTSHKNQRFPKIAKQVIPRRR